MGLRCLSRPDGIGSRTSRLTAGEGRAGLSEAEGHVDGVLRDFPWGGKREEVRFEEMESKERGKGEERNVRKCI